MTGRRGTADLLRELAPRALAAVVRRYGHFADAEDAVQEALLAAAVTWPAGGTPDNPLAWLIRVASRKMADQYRSDEARRRREEIAASWSLIPHEPVPAYDDTLTLMLMCCHPALSPGAAIPLALRAVGGLTTREIAAAFLVPEATMAQRISRAKAKLKAADEPFALPPPGRGGERLPSVLHVLYLIFNEGYAASDGPDLARGRQRERLLRRLELRLGPADPLRHRRLGNEECGGDLPGGQPADRAQRERDGRARRQRRVAAHQHEDQRVVVRRDRLARDQGPRRGEVFPPAPGLVPPVLVSHLARGHPDEPRERVVRRPVGRPGGGGGKQRLLHGVLRVGEVAVAPDDGAEGPRREVAQQVHGRRLAGHTSGSGALSTARTSMA